MTILADGQISTTQANIFVVDDTDVLNTAKASVNKITVFNTSAIAQTVIVFLKRRNGTAREVGQFILLEDERGEVLEPGDVVDLENGDAYRAITTTASVVDFVVSGDRL